MPTESHFWSLGGDNYPEDGLRYLRIDGHHEFELKQQQVYYAGVGYRPEGDLRTAD